MSSLEISLNADCITDVYDKLEPKLKASLLKEYEANRITGKEYAFAFSQTLTTLMQIASQYPLTDAQVKLVNAQEKELLELLPSKKETMENQSVAEENKAVLYKRQAEAYDDNLRIEKAKQYSNAIGMVYAGGMDVNESIWATLKEYVDNIE